MGVVCAGVCCCHGSSSIRDGLWQDGLVVALRGLLLGRCLAGTVVRRLAGRTGWW